MGTAIIFMEYNKCMDNPLISIVCVSLNNWEYIDLFLRGLEKNTVNSFEVLIHGNCARSRFSNIVHNNKYVVKYTKSVNNLHIAEPANKLFKFAKGKYFVVLDDDMYVAPGWDEALLKKVNPSILYQYLTPTIITYDKSSRPNFNKVNFGTTYDAFREDEFNLKWKETRTILEDSPYVIENFLITRELWADIEGYSVYYERSAGPSLDLIAMIYFKALNKHYSMEFRQVADSCVYHFENACRIHGSKGNVLGPKIFEAFWYVSPGEFDKMIYNTWRKI